MTKRPDPIKNLLRLERLLNRVIKIVEAKNNINNDRRHDSALIQISRRITTS